VIGVCHVASGDAWGGAEAVVLHLLEGLARYGDVRTHAFLLNEGRLAESLKGAGVPVTVAEEGRTSFAGTVRALRKVVEGFRPHILHSHRYKENALALLASGGMGSVKRIVTQHGMPGGRAEGVRLKSRLVSGATLRLVSRWADRMVPVSDDIREALLGDYGFRPERTKTIRNGIPVPGPVSSRAREGPFVAGSAGRLSPVKDFARLVEVAREVRARGEDIRFELAGEGPQKGLIAEAIGRYGLEGTFFMRGFVEDMDGFLGGLSLYVSTSVHEGIPLGALEAMARGIPVVAPDAGGFREIIEDGMDGCLVKDRDVGTYADRCIALKSDRDSWARMGESAREKAASFFSVDRMVREYRELYLETARGG
jgi:glycosyltransferase involved in cell wall biosynthesis